MTSFTDTKAGRHLPVRKDWLALGDEPALEPALPILDPHHHFWDEGDKQYMLPDLVADIGQGHNVKATVYIECRSTYHAEGPIEERPLGETEFVTGLAAMSESGKYGKAHINAGIIGYVDLMLGDRAGPLLEQHMAVAGKRFRGIRNSTVSHPDPTARGSVLNRAPGMLLEPKFREGFAHLKRLGLTFDSWVYHTQIGELADIARRFPDTPVILDHIGGVIGIGPYAGKRQETFAEWKAAMTGIAKCANVRVKLGGAGMYLFGFEWHSRPKPPSSADIAEGWKPYVETCIELFGAKRCMFESNFPVDKASFGYGVCWNAFKRIAAKASADEKADLFWRTAATTYQIPFTA